jgi:hypothetical protein
MGHEQFASGPALAASASLQAIENVCQSLIALVVQKVEVDSRVGERATKAKNQRELLRGELVAIFLERRGQVVSCLVSKCWVGHGLLGEPLQHVDANRTVLGRYHRNIVLTRKCYCLNDRDCTSPVTETALAHRGGALMSARVT